MKLLDLFRKRERSYHCKMYGSLYEWEIQELSVYNSEVMRGLVHTEAMNARMQILQDKFDYFTKLESQKNLALFRANAAQS